MKVVRQNLEGTQVQRLIVTAPDKYGHHVGECIGYLCPECFQADETLSHIWHQEDCSLAGQHGRDVYDDLEPVVPGRPTREFEPENKIAVVTYAETEGRGGLHKGEVIGFECEHCGNFDEDLFEIVHDEACPLAGKHGRIAEASSNPESPVHSVPRRPNPTPSSSQ